MIGRPLSLAIRGEGLTWEPCGDKLDHPDPGSWVEGFEIVPDGDPVALPKYSLGERFGLDEANRPN